MKLSMVILVLFAISINTFSVAQEKDYASYNLHPPLEIPLVLAGNFGELRNNHFHTGIDIKTNHRTGYNILSVEDGYVSRIKVSPWGYGHVVYIDHYNGLTSVYAHCESFVGEIYDLAYSQQKKNEDFTFEYFPPKDSLKVKKGQVIAKSGNTGSSTAPHLHFELRETKSELALNPLLFNFDIEDSRPPIMRELKVYALTREGYRVPNKERRFVLQGSIGKYSVSGNTITLDASYASKEGGIGFAVDILDKLDAAENICGINEAYLIVNNDTLFVQDMEKISFLTNRHINTHKDYEEFHSRRKHFHKTFKTIHNPLPIYKKAKNNGIINVEPGKSYDIQYIAKDAYKNTSTLSFTLKVNEGQKIDAHTLYTQKKVLYPDSAFLSYDANHYILFPPGLVYEPTPLLLKASKNKVQFGSDKTPLQETFKIMLPIEDNTLKDKYYIERTSSKGATFSERGTVKEGWITARTRFFGSFSVQIDTVAPRISNRNFRDNSFVGKKRLSWNIVGTKSGLADYDVFIDGEWFLLQYEPKRSMFFFDPPKELTGKKSVVIRAIDACGNKSEKEYTLTF